MSVETSLVGQSPPMRETRRLIDKLARTNSPVLLLGETGTGKEVVARAIYEGNPTGPFVPIDCGALSGSLMETELFGYVKGAFTGAAASKPGLIEIADGGTAFFDEVSEIPLELQAKLLRVLQEREFRPVGSVARRKAHFRLIAASNRELARQVEQGAFRRDLYYRLAVCTVRLPPLRQRKQDIPELAAHFLSVYGTSRRLHPEVLDAFQAYDWPGNVRELENCIQRMTALNSGPELGIADLPTALQHVALGCSPGNLSLAAAACAEPAAAPAPPVVPLSETKRREILRALEFAKGDRVLAAHLLGIGRTTLYRKLKQYRISP